MNMQIQEERLFIANMITNENEPSV